MFARRTFLLLCKDTMLCSSLKSVRELRPLLVNAGAADIYMKAPSASARGKKLLVVYVPGENDEKTLRLALPKVVQ